jgi:type II secretory pathway pseudopilin PulG
MRANKQRERGFTVVEMVMTSGLLSVVGIAILSMLNTGMVLGAKNTAVNTAHQQARTAMLQMISDLHAAVSLPYLIDSSGNPIVPTPGSSPSPAPGIGFQLYSMGPLKVAADAATDDDVIMVNVPASITTAPLAGQRLIVPSHQFEKDITKVKSKGSGNYELTFAANIGIKISGTGSPTNYNIVCFITDRCSYRVIGGALDWTGPTTKKTFAVLGNGITNPNPFTTPQTAAGAYDYKFIAAIDLSTTDSKYSNRGFKSANILLNGKVPTRARLTTYQ